MIGQYEPRRGRCQWAGHVDVASGVAVLGPGRLMPGRPVCRERVMGQASRLEVDERP